MTDWGSASDREDPAEELKNKGRLSRQSAGDRLMRGWAREIAMD